jgi:hypothetical protein
MQTNMTFKAPMDIRVKSISVGIVILFVFIVFGPIIFDKDENLEVSILIGLLLFPVIGITYAISPRLYHISEDNIEIERLINTIKINISEIKSVCHIDKEKLKWSIRTFGVGGLFGYFGKFWNKEFGHMTWYCSQRDKLIMIITKDNKKIVISPNDSELFLFEMVGRI